MALHICKNVAISLSRNHPLYLHKPHHASSITVLFFSSSRPKISKQPTTDVSNYLINQHQFSPEAALKVSSVVKCLKNTKSTDSILFYLNEIGFSKTQLEDFVKRVPQVLSANLDRTIKPKFNIFHDLGLIPTDVSRQPNADVSKVLKLSVWFWNNDLQKSLMPNIEFMKSCGISLSQLLQFVFNFPRLFLHKPESIIELVKRVDEMGVDRKSKMFIHAIRVMSSMTAENWELKLKHFRSMGFSEDGILVVFRRIPQVFAVSNKKIKDMTHFLLSSGMCDHSFLLHYPELLVYSIEGRIKPRLRVLTILESKNLLVKKPSLTTVCKVSKKQFVERYVLPYSEELGDQLKLCKYT